MQTSLTFQQDIDTVLWNRAAKRECLKYREHGTDIENRDGRISCFNCGDEL